MLSTLKLSVFSLPGRGKSFAFVLAMLFLLSALVLSITAAEVGSITGKVTDAETGEVLRGATVLVIGTKKGSKSDVKGTFTVKQVEVGSYELKFSYIGYKAKQVKGVTVEAGGQLRTGT